MMTSVPKLTTEDLLSDGVPKINAAIDNANEALNKSAQVELAVNEVDKKSLKGKPGKNLFNKETVIHGYYISYSTGLLVAGAGFSASDYIEIEPNVTYTKKENQQLAFYDANKAYVSGLASATIFTTPSNAKYVRLTTEKTKLDIQQLEEGSVSTAYEPFSLSLPPETIRNNSIGPEALKESYLKGVVGKNLFNKNTVTIGKYVNWNTGVLSSNSSYSVSDYIPINPSTTYTVSHNGQLAFYDADKAYVSGIATPTTFTTTVNVSFVRISVLIANLDTFQLEIGSSKTDYEIYGTKIEKSNYSASEIKDVIGLNVDEITVAPSGGDFNKISDAIASITDANINKKYRIIVKNGTYIDTFRTKHYVDIIGEDKYKTVIDYTGNINDWNTLSTIFGETNSTIENMTIIAKDCKYPIHSDANTGAYKLIVRNCILDHKGGSDGRAGTPFGIGLYQGQNIEILDCELYANGTSGSAGVFFHNMPSTAGIGYRSLRVENCKISGVTYGFRVNGISVTLDQKNDAFLINNDIQAELAEIMIDATTDLSWNVISRGNTLFKVYQPNNNYIVQQPGFTKTYKNTGTTSITKGDVVLLNGSNVVVNQSNAVNSPLVVGVSLQDIPANAMGVVQISGYVNQCKVGGATSIANNELLSSALLGRAEKTDIRPFAIAKGTFTGGGSDALIPVILLPNISH